jgi:drug/metabolite transporter (DMT)-like permease
VWLLRNAPLSLVTTYAFVNPVVAVVLGALILGERFTIRSAVATVAVVLGVILMLRRGAAEAPPAVDACEPNECPDPSPDQFAA